MMRRECLEPRRKLVEAVAEWLMGKARKSAEGATTLAHLMVVVPTAQSGRNLRLTLAKEAAKRGWGGILPPKVVQPMHLVKPADETFREATPIESAIAFQQFVKAHREEIGKFDRIIGLDAFNDKTAEELTARFALFDQLEDIWRALAGRGLLMQDATTAGKAALEADIGDERERWEQLAQLEKSYFDYLHEHKVAYPTERVHMAKTNAAIIGDEIEEIVLPALADPVRVLGDVLEQQVAAGKRVTVLLHAKPEESERFDTWGWPKTQIANDDRAWRKLTNADIVCATNSSALAQIAADHFPPAKPDKLPPSVVLCDDELYQGVASAFLNRGYAIHNPERHLLVQSSLGRLIKNLIALYPEGDLPWRECMAVLRSTDVQSALGLTAKVRESVLRGADIAQNAFIPSSIPKGFAFQTKRGIKEWQKEDLAKFCEVGRQLESLLATARKGASLGAFLRRTLQTIFAAHSVGGRADEKEFLAAAEGARTFLASLESNFIAEFNPTNVEFEAIARRALGGVTYSLEPDAADAIKTEGWLELPWTTGEQVALIGLHEGKVPDSIVGHPFLPDALRKELGIVTNEERFMRDAWILRELLDSHGEHAVRAYVARTNDDGDICRPSRLLYLCPDAELPERVQTLFGDLPLQHADKSHKIEWPLKLPDNVKTPDHFSASALDVYVKCPFTYLLKCVLKMDAYKEKRELEASDFGTFIHNVLEDYAQRQIKCGDDQLTDASAIRRMLLDEIVPSHRARFANPTLNIELQLRAAEGRLALFAERQAAWAQQGWRIREAECTLDDDVPELGVRIKGSIDRVDENINAAADKHWCLIDYKTWDAMRSKFNANVMTPAGAKQPTKEKHFGFANALGFPLVLNADGQPVQRILSVQLPIYGKSYAAKHREIAFEDMEFRYFVLGKNAEETGICDTLKDNQVEAALGTAKRAIKLIKAGIFWPPGLTDEWKWEHSGLFVTDPATDLGDTDWAKRQREKLEACHD